jgi:hypothetical protein
MKSLRIAVILVVSAQVLSFSADMMSGSHVAAMLLALHSVLQVAAIYYLWTFGAGVAAILQEPDAQDDTSEHMSH